MLPLSPQMFLVCVLWRLIFMLELPFQLKANLRAGLVTLEQYLASVGAISLATGRKKVEDDGDEGIEPSFEPHGAGEVSIYIADATPDQTITELPWPAPQPFEVIAEVEPSTQVSTTVDPAVAKTIRPNVRTSKPPKMGTSLLTLDSLENFLREHNLGLRSRAKILGDGNCWWRSVADLIKLYGLNALIDPGLLRKMVVASLKTHPRKMDSNSLRGMI